MASALVTTPDTMVTLKVSFNGTSRRLKLPLRDLGAASLEEKVRNFLMIPTSKYALFERYSDSAAAFVHLDPANTSVYKQLYRAAKAKQRLKLRITTSPEPEVKEEQAAEPEIKAEPKQVPKPVTIEDEPEPEQPAPIKAAEEKKQPPVEATPAAAAIPSHAEEMQRLAMRLKASTEQLSNEEKSFTETWHDKLAKLEHKIREAERAAAIFAGEPASHAPAAPATPVAAPNAARWFENCMVTPPRNPTAFAICCNSCDKTIPNEHFHCSICDDGDFDLCQECVDKGVSCHSAGHWLIKRSVENGSIKASTTERVLPKPKAAAVQNMRNDSQDTLVKAESLLKRVSPMPFIASPIYHIRTCNCCVQELPEHKFVHCTSCDDYDLCLQCFTKDIHGHHPKHAFVPATSAADIDSLAQVRLEPGRNVQHNAICDGCDKYICGVRHKCLDCPDWDYCSECVVNASFVHANHRFVPIYEPLNDFRSRVATEKPIHYGICCDGPLCAGPRVTSGYIRGDRFKCAVCHDTDFCASCEASPANAHNKTHPLIKFKTPVRHVSVTTSGEHEDGRVLPRMGDRVPSPASMFSSPAAAAETSSRSTETTAQEENTASPVQTVVDVQPEPTVKEEEEAEIKEEVIEEEKEAEVKPEVTPEVKPEVKPEPVVEQTPAPEDLVAVYVTDTVTDGTVLSPNVVFEQTWVLRNCGSVAWPAGCSVKFVGGDYMGHVDPNHPAGIHELVSASESTVCYAPLAPGQEFSFTVLLRTPSREGRVISYWRLTTKEGIKFGHRLWCDVNVAAPKVPVVATKVEEKAIAVEAAAVAVEVPPPVQSQMIFPKLEKESPASSVVVEEQGKEAAKQADDFEDCGDEEWNESDDEDDGFMTDEEYDILDASDEEYLQDQSKKLLKK